MFHVEHSMIKKTFTLLLVFITFTFARISALEDAAQDSAIASVELSKIYENKYNPFSVLFLGGVGYTSTRRFEVDVACLSAANIGSKLFGIDRLLVDFTALRFDFRLERTEGEKEISAFSIGSTISTLSFYILASVTPEESVLNKIALGGMWLSSGTTKYMLYGNNLSGISLAESHTIEWFIQQSTYDGKTKTSMKEFGFIEEVGIQFDIMLAQVTAGVSFEITNKQRNIGWFVKIIALPIPIDRLPSQK